MGPASMVCGTGLITLHAAVIARPNLRCLALQRAQRLPEFGFCFHALPQKSLKLSHRTHAARERSDCVLVKFFLGIGFLWAGKSHAETLSLRRAKIYHGGTETQRKIPFSSPCHPCL